MKVTQLGESKARIGTQAARHQSLHVQPPLNTPPSATCYREGRACWRALLLLWIMSFDAVAVISYLKNN